MTIAITIKVHDGVVIASDSATTLVENTNVTTVYNNANKIFHLYKSNNNIPHGLPLGIVTYGLGGIGNSSISTLIKDFRKNLSNGKIEFNPSEYKNFFDAYIERDKYGMENVNKSLKTIGAQISGLYDEFGESKTNVEFGGISPFPTSLLP